MARSVEEFDTLPGRAAVDGSFCRWLVALDYDGTLRGDDACPIEPEFLSLMAAWRPYGVRWGINTGRSLGYLCEELLSCLSVLPDFLCTTERFAYLANGQGCVVPAMDFNRESFEANARLRRELHEPLAAEMARICALHPEWEWVFAPNDPLSVQAKDSATMDAIAPLLQPFVDSLAGVAMQRASRFMRLSDARFNKATALGYVMQQWQVDAAHLFAMGDGHNDLDVFKRFPSSYFGCPADAHPDIIALMPSMGGHVSESRGVISLLRRWFEERVLPEAEKCGIKCQQMSVSA